MDRWLSRFTLAWRFSLAVGVALLCGLAVSGVLVWRLDATASSYDTMLGTREVQHQDRARVIQVTFKKQVQEWKSLLLRGHRPDDLQKHKRGFLADEAAVGKLTRSLIDDVQDEQARRQLTAFLRAHEGMGRAYGAGIQLFEASQGRDPGAADARVKGQDRAPTDLLDEIAKRLQRVLEDMRRAQSARVERTIRLSVLAALGAFAIGSIFVVLIARTTQREMAGLAGQLAGGARGTASAASELSASAQALSQGATEQAASLEETSASMEEMASMTRANAQNCESVARLMGEVDGSVTASNLALRQMVDSMTSMRESSKQVAKIIKTIDEIAFQPAGNSPTASLRWRKPSRRWRK